MNVIDYLPIYTAEQWAGISASIAVVAAVGTFLQVIIAWLGLAYIGRQIRDARRSSDVQNLFAFYKAITDAEQSLLNAFDDNDRDRAFYELTNLLEAHAMALRGRIYTGVTREAVELKLIDACALIQMSEFWSSKLDAGRSTPSAFKDLFRFMKRHRRKIEKVKRLSQSSEPPSNAPEATLESSRSCEPVPATPIDKEAPKGETSLWWKF